MESDPTTSPTAPAAAPPPADGPPAATATATSAATSVAAAAAAAPSPASATYEILRQRLSTLGETLRERLHALDARRREVFGSIESKILQADRITTAHNCLPRDLIRLGPGQFLFGFNVHFGLKKEIELGDVFALYERDEASGSFREGDLAPLRDPRFLTDFKRLYQVYEKAAFSKLSEIEGRLYMVFRIGAGPNDIAVFKWGLDGGQLRYIDGRAEADYRRIGFPAPHQFRWLTPDRQSFRYGDHPHVSIEDRVFVECVGGDLTIKIEDNTASGEGVYSERVEDRHQKVDDAEIAYAILDPLVLLKVRPYKETTPRFFVFHQKLHTVHRVDALGQSCALLPEEHGLIFPDGFYLATGELKQFEARESGLVLERVLHAPNGEDSLFVFYDAASGVYVLMAYRLIAQQVDERIACHGFSLFPNGHLLLFRADPEPQKHHTVQLRQTPFHEKGHEPPGHRDAFLYQIGNKDVVRCLAESNEIASLVQRRDPYAELYADVVKRCAVVLSAYPWLTHADALRLDAALRDVRDAASQAVDEFDKVRRLQRDAVQQVATLRKRCDEQFGALRRASFNRLDDHVHHLASLRRLRGDLITLRDVRYIDLAALDELEKSVVARADELAAACVAFLLKPEALEPYRKRAAEHLAAVDHVARVIDGKKLDEAAAAARVELEMLVEIVNNLRIDDATETTRILDAITAVYSTLNQVRAALHKRLQSLGAVENAARFAAQMKLLGQSAASFLDLCDSPAKCDEYLNRLAVQLEELEGAFADFEDCTVRIAERRTELYEAFEQRKLALIEQRSRRAGAVMAAAERILKVIQNRLANLPSIAEINTYLAADLMVAKVRDQIAELLALGDSVKADALQGRLKAAHQEAVRQLKDRQELFVGGPGVIQLGRHRFNVNTQPLDLTVVHRDGEPFLHLTGTRYFDAITDEAFLATRTAWNQELPSEDPDVYRAEFLAHRLLESLEATRPPLAGVHPHPGAPPPTHPTPSDSRPSPATPESLLALSDDQRLAWVQDAMAPRLQEGYIKGVHDHDTVRILHALLGIHVALRLARHAPDARACATVFWHRFCPPDLRALWLTRLRAFGERNRIFPGDPTRRTYSQALIALIATFARDTGLYSPDLAEPAGEYLFHELTSGDRFVSSREADELVHAFQHHLVAKGSESAFAHARTELAAHPESDLDLVRDWIRGFLLARPPSAARHLEEAAAILFCGPALVRTVVDTSTTRVLDPLKGSHPRIHGTRYDFDYLEFRERLQRFDREVVPRFEQYRHSRQILLDRERARLRLDEFRPRILTSFVRNELIDEVYLPLIGDNLAKQIGAAGDQKRTDLMGLLLVVSPPGYGKTTLLEYIASRLGIVFVKINGPALGHAVTSLDPEDAPNAAAREEIHKLNLAFEMGDNAMICIDDIQHCNPEFLQKFISLCDGQRKIEGVWRGRPRTYDLRGRKIVVVMAGNPYTESGQKFKIPDMLANRADTYNLGDVIGSRADAFKASYLENSATSNTVLATVATRHPKDIRTFIRRAQSADAAPDPAGLGGFEGEYSPQEIEEILAVTRRLIAVREVVLRVNQEYIASAGQADDYRTEPAFRLQGSYRNMNRLAEKIVPIMNDEEVRAVLLDHYRNEAQTLTSGTEANLLKFKELTGWLSTDEAARWAEIQRTFRRHQLVRGSGDANDPVSRVVSQLAAFHAGLEGIQNTLQTHLQRALLPPPPPPPPPLPAPPPPAPVAATDPTTAPAPAPVDLSPLVQGLQALRDTLVELPRTFARSTVPAPATVPAAIPIPPAPAPPDTSLADRLAEGLVALRQDLTRAIAVTHSTTIAERVDSLSHELEMIHSTLATLKDIAGQQRDHLRSAQDLLAARARQGTVEFEVTQDMLTNEQAFLERFHEVLAQTGKAVPPENPAPADLPPRIGPPP